LAPGCKSGLKSSQAFAKKGFKSSAVTGPPLPFAGAAGFFAEPAGGSSSFGTDFSKIIQQPFSLSQIALSNYLKLPSLS